jgi:hypothetical protein
MSQENPSPSWIVAESDRERVLSELDRHVRMERQFNGDSEHG